MPFSDDLGVETANRDAENPCICPKVVRVRVAFRFVYIEGTVGNLGLGGFVCLRLWLVVGVCAIRTYVGSG